MHYGNFLKKTFGNFLKISKHSVIIPNEQDFSACFVTYAEKYAKIMRFSQFLTNFLKFSKTVPPRKITGHAHGLE